MRAAAGAITKASRYGANPQELADSLFSDLFGLMDGKRGDRSLSVIFTAQFAEDLAAHSACPAPRGLHPLAASNGIAGCGGWRKPALPVERVQQQPLQDPHRAHYLSCFSTALRHCLKTFASRRPRTAGNSITSGR